MKTMKYLSVILCAFWLFSLSVWAAPSTDFNPASDSAVLMDLGTGQILFEKNPDKQQYPAGLVKAVAALTAMESTDLDTILTASDAAIGSVYGTNTLGLVSGEVLSLREALYGMLMQSANDCAVIAAENISGDTASFVAKMNETVKNLGCNNTNFTNVTGLFAQDNYTTARDMATIIKKASENPNYIEIAGTKSYPLPATNKAGARTLSTRCPLLSSYEFAKSGIGGYTDEGKYTMAVTASNGNLNLLAVVMNAPDENSRNNDCVELLNFGFENYQTFTITPEELQIPKSKLMGAMGKIGTVTFKLENPVSVLAPIEATFDNLEFQYPKKSYKQKEDMTGTITVLYNGEKITELNLTGIPEKKITFYSVIKTILLIILIVIVILVLLFVYYIYDAERKKKKRKQDKLKRTLRIKKDI